MEATGNCFEANFLLLLDVSQIMPNAVLVHAEVAGQGPLQGVQFGHAFVQWNGLVCDNTNGGGVTLPANLYRDTGRIDEINNAHTYTVGEAVAKIIEHGHYGPWDLVTSTGL